jgi:hypothetical protein
MRGRSVYRLALLAALAVALCASQGCTTLSLRARGPGQFVGLYFKDRYEDLAEMVDLGLTISEESNFALYGHFASLTPFGVANVDGKYIGIGGGQIGTTRHSIMGAGALMWGYEELGWQDHDPDDLTTLSSAGVGPIGLILPPYHRPGAAPS